MKKHLSISKIMMRAAFLAVLPLTLVSCGSYYYYSDGIYDDPMIERPRYVEVVENPVADRYYAENFYTPTPNKYRDYFGDKAEQYKQTPDTTFSHFTDVNGYRSQAYTGNAPSYGGWGSNPNQVNVNVYNGYNGYNGYNSYYGYRSPYYGYYDDPYYYRNRARWNLQLGWGWSNYYGGYYDPYYDSYYYRYNPYYYNYYNPYYNPYYGYNYYGYYPYYRGYYYDDYYYYRPRYRSDYYYDGSRYRSDGYRRSYTNDRYGNPGGADSRDYNSRSYNGSNNNSYSSPSNDGRYRNSDYSQQNSSSGRYTQPQSQPQRDSGRSYDSGRYQSSGGGNYGNSNSSGSSSSGNSGSSGATRRDY